MRPNLTEKLILKYLEGTITPEETKLLTEWIDQSEANSKCFVNLVNHWELTDFDVNLSQYKIWQGLVARNRQSGKPTKSFGNFSVRFFYMAASVALILGVIGVLVLGREDAGEQAPAQQTRITKQTAYGEKRSFMLPDDTKVKLNAGSEISFPLKFAKGERRVCLVGEAFFEVTPDVTRPFIVELEHVEVQVIGTSFNVKAYSTDADHSIAVKSGKVKVQHRDDQLDLILERDQMVTMSKDHQVWKREYMEAGEMIYGWVDNYLCFDELDFHATMELVSKWYGVTYQTAVSASMQQRITGKFKNPTLKAVMESISHIYDFEYEISGKNILIRK